ncbi:cytochrome P450 [Streptomyces sp. NPDC058247]|uniref:cytochrome P450 n=1 Tax=Streptomyces sp. NPDC058247 TaxID=3346401 RepID=UPI0036ECA0B4
MSDAAHPRLFGDEFTDHPDDVYAQLRAAGPLAWAEIAEGVRALVVTDHAAARELLRDPLFSRDPALWSAVAERTVPRELARMVVRGLQHTDGAAHERLRRALDDCLGHIDLHEVRRRVRTQAHDLIAGFAARGQADLLAEYAEPLVARTLADLIGCPPEQAGRLERAVMALGGADPAAAQAWEDLAELAADVVAAKRRRPGRDLASMLLAHPAALDDDESVQQLLSVALFAAVPTAAWITFTLHTLLTTPAYASLLVGGSVTIRRAMNETLSTGGRCPVAHSAAHYPRQDTHLRGVLVPAGTPVLVSYAAAGQDPNRPGPGGPHDRSHLAWSAGAHSCPARGLAMSLAEAAVESAVDTLWDLTTLTPHIAGKSGFANQCPVHLGVLFSSRGQEVESPHLTPEEYTGAR